MTTAQKTINCYLSTKVRVTSQNEGQAIVDNWVCEFDANVPAIERTRTEDRLIWTESDKWMALDNTCGECWVAEFDSLDKAFAYCLGLVDGDGEFYE